MIDPVASKIYLKLETQKSNKEGKTGERGKLTLDSRHLTPVHSLEYSKEYLQDRASARRNSQCCSFETNHYCIQRFLQQLSRDMMSMIRNRNEHGPATIDQIEDPQTSYAQIQQQEEWNSHKNWIGSTKRDSSCSKNWCMCWQTCLLVVSTS